MVRPVLLSRLQAVAVLQALRRQAASAATTRTYGHLACEEGLGLLGFSLVFFFFTLIRPTDTWRVMGRGRWGRRVQGRGGGRGGVQFDGAWPMKDR